MTTKRTCFYLEDDDFRTDTFCRPIAEEDDLGNYYIEIVCEGEQDNRKGSVLIPSHLVHEFLRAFDECNQELATLVEEDDGGGRP